ncbi:MAG: hypothetical protein ACYCOR_20950 [Acidobacteriaceae bacterium]
MTEMTLEVVRNHHTALRYITQAERAEHAECEAAQLSENRDG